VKRELFAVDADNGRIAALGSGSGSGSSTAGRGERGVVRRVVVPGASPMLGLAL
jgi:hypothetical protein